MSTINLGLPIIPESKDQQSFNDLVRIFNSIRNLAEAVDVRTGYSDLTSSSSILSTVLSQNLNRLYIPFTEAATPGQAVNIFSNSGVTSAKLAGGSGISTNIAMGICESTVAIGEYGLIHLQGLVTTIGGLVAGQTYYTSTTVKGGITSASPTGSRQVIGYALDTSLLYLNPHLFLF